jgi:hypothetical protein
MSVRAITKVWEGYPGGGSELLVLLALADWSDDDGRCWPAMASIAKKVRLSEKQVRRIVHSVIEAGYLSVTDNMQGGATSRRYKINLVMLDTPPAHGSPPAHVPNPSRPWEPTPPAHGSRTVIDTSRTVREVAQDPSGDSEKSKKRKSEITLQTFLDQCKTSGGPAIPENDPIFAYAEKVGIDSEMVSVCWAEFKAAYLPKTTKKQNDWRAHFRNAVKRNWYKLWFVKESEVAQWTTAGEQARRAAL